MDSIANQLLICFTTGKHWWISLYSIHVQKQLPKLQASTSLLLDEWGPIHSIALIPDIASSTEPAFLIIDAQHRLRLIQVPEPSKSYTGVKMLELASNIHTLWLHKPSPSALISGVLGSSSNPTSLLMVYIYI
jgi:hypothetical protein